MCFMISLILVLLVVIRAILTMIRRIPARAPYTSYPTRGGNRDPDRVDPPGPHLEPRLPLQGARTPVIFEEVHAALGNGDILLVHGNSALAKAVNTVGGTWYNPRGGQNPPLTASRCSHGRGPNPSNL